jgi:hypothetical protein
MNKTVRLLLIGAAIWLAVVAVVVMNIDSLQKGVEDEMQRTCLDLKRQHYKPTSACQRAGYNW